MKREIFDLDMAKFFAIFNSISKAIGINLGNVTYNILNREIMNQVAIDSTIENLKTHDKNNKDDLIVFFKEAKVELGYQYNDPDIPLILRILFCDRSMNGSSIYRYVGYPRFKDDKYFSIIMIVPTFVGMDNVKMSSCAATLFGIVYREFLNCRIETTDNSIILYRYEIVDIMKFLARLLCIYDSNFKMDPKIEEKVSPLLDILDVSENFVRISNHDDNYIKVTEAALSFIRRYTIPL